MITEAFVTTELKRAAVARRYEAAQHWEISRQAVRECSRYGFAITDTMRAEVRDAERSYDEATRAVVRVGAP